jgi:lysophospholipase L1-like esterase
MYEILCFGDSNTWGYSPETGGRFGRDLRWTGVLQRTLGSGFFVIEEGQGGRTTVWDDPVEGGNKNGLAYLAPCLESHAPLDLVVLMLGTNDVKKRFGVTAFDIGLSISRLVALVLSSSSGRDWKAPKLLLVAPPPLARLTAFAEMFQDGAEKSMKFGETYREIAKRFGCAFLDAGEVIASSAIDGIHFEEDGHRKLGQAIAGKVRLILTA